MDARKRQKPHSQEWLCYGRLKWGERPLGGNGRSRGVGKFKKVTVEPELPGLVRWTGQTEEDQNSENRDTGYDHHRRFRSF